MKLREILRNISRVPEVHLKLGSHYLIVLNEGKKFRCLTILLEGLQVWRRADKRSPQEIRGISELSQGAEERTWSLEGQGD